MQDETRTKGLEVPLAEARKEVVLLWDQPRLVSVTPSRGVVPPSGSVPLAFTCAPEREGDFLVTARIFLESPRRPDVELPIAVRALAQSGAYFLRGDANGDAQLDIADAITILSHLFAGRNAVCAAAFDANADGMLDIADPISLLTHLFAHGAPPSTPFPACGYGETALPCAEEPCAK
jgi:hypothetical protein